MKFRRNRKDAITTTQAEAPVAEATDTDVQVVRQIDEAIAALIINYVMTMVANDTGADATVGSFLIRDTVACTGRLMDAIMAAADYEYERLVLEDVSLKISGGAR